jgi:hypothetical protein
MPDIQTALNNALNNAMNNQLKNTINEWEKDDMQTTQTNTQPKSTRFFDITNNVTRATFDYVKHRPNETSAEICASMAKLGYKESSVGSLLAQFAKQGLAERDDRGRYITIVPEYKPLKNKKKEAKVVAKPVETPKRKYEKRSEGIAALQPEPTPPQPKRFVTLVRSKTPDDILKDMTVFQARELYDYLKKMFGG